MHDNSECGTATAAQETILRTLTPVAKLYLARLCTAMMLEGCESFGGAGYMLDTGIPQVHLPFRLDGGGRRVGSGAGQRCCFWVVG